MAFAQTGAGNADKAGTLLKFRDGVRAEVPHAGAYAAQYLMDRVVKGAFEGHAPLDAFGDETCVGVLTIAVAGAFAHGALTAHAAIVLVGPALIQDHFPRSLV